MDLIETKEARLSIRLDTAQKLLISEAAKTLGISLSSFILSNTLKAANEVVSQHQQIVLSDRDWKRFQEIITEDVEPTQAAMKAAKRYKKG